jgi:hypothetical protein
VTSRFDEIARRKEALIAQCARERDELCTAFSRIRSPFELGKIVIGLTRSLKAHPIVAAGISSLLASGYAGKLLRTAGEGLQLWRLLRPLLSWWKKRRRTSRSSK